MPDTAPSISFLKKQKVLPISKEDREAYDASVRAQQENDPLWKKLGRNAVSAASGATQGFFGFEPSEDERKYDPTSNYANLAGQLYGLGAIPFAKATIGGISALKAGMPLALMTKGEKLLHGTKSVYNEINPALADTSDTLGHMFHATPNPDYAEDYSLGYIKNRPGPENPNTIAVAPKAKNVVDLYGEHKNADDLAQLVAQVKDPQDKKDLIKNWRKAVRGEDKGLFGNDSPLAPTANRSRFMQSLLNHMTPEVTNSMPFDAIRYNDAGHEAYAFPHDTPIETPWGVPLNKTPKQLQVTKLPHDAPIGLNKLSPYFQPPDTKPTHFMIGGMSPEEIDKLVGETNAGKWIVTNPNGEKMPLADWKGYGDEVTHKMTLKDYLNNQHDWQGFSITPPEGNALSSHPAAYTPKKTVKQMIMGTSPQKTTKQMVDEAALSSNHPYAPMLQKNPYMDFSDWSIKNPSGKLSKVSEYGSHPETGGNEVAKGIINFPDIWHGYEIHPPEGWVPYGGGSNWQAPTGSAESITASGLTANSSPSQFQAAAGKAAAGESIGSPPFKTKNQLFAESGSKTTKQLFDEFAAEQSQGKSGIPPPGGNPPPHINPYDSGPTTQPPAGYYPGVDMSDWDVTTPNGQKLKVKDYGPKADMHDWLTQRIIGQHPGWEGYKLEKPPEEDLSHFFEPEYDDPSNKEF